MKPCYICTWPFTPHRHTASRQRTCGEKRCARQHKRNYAKGRKPPKSLIPDDLAAVKSAWSGNLQKMVAFYLMAQSGLRVSELVQLRIDDFLRPDGGLRETFMLTAERTKTNADPELCPEWSSKAVPTRMVVPEIATPEAPRSACTTGSLGTSSD